MKLEDIDPIKRQDLVERMDADLRRAAIFDRLELELKQIGYEPSKSHKIIKRVVSEIGWSSGYEEIKRCVSREVGHPLPSAQVTLPDLPKTYVTYTAHLVKEQGKTSIDSLSKQLGIPRTSVSLLFQAGVKRGILKRVKPGTYAYNEEDGHGVQERRSSEGEEA